jgi:hypothetical protein
MNYLFIHQNFPGQYLHLVRHLAQQPRNQVYFITQPNANVMTGVHKITYPKDSRERINAKLLRIVVTYKRSLNHAIECVYELQPSPNPPKAISLKSDLAKPGLTLSRLIARAFIMSPRHWGAIG